MACHVHKACQNVVRPCGILAGLVKHEKVTPCLNSDGHKQRHVGIWCAPYPNVKYCTCDVALMRQEFKLCLDPGPHPGLSRVSVHTQPFVHHDVLCMARDGLCIVIHTHVFDLSMVCCVVQHEKEEDMEERLCVICLNKDRDTTVLPCRHMCMCHECAQELRKQTSKCPICRNHVESLLHIKMQQKPSNKQVAAAVAASGGDAAKLTDEFQKLQVQQEKAAGGAAGANMV